MRATEETVRIANVDLALERQRLLREKLEELFAVLGKRTRVRKRLEYVANADEAPLDRVLRQNRDADALFTGFNYDIVHSEAYKQRITVGEGGELPEVEPQLRYPVIADYLRHVDQGHFRHRRVILVGDIRARIAAFLHSELPVSVTVPGIAKGQPARVVHITGTDRLTDDPEAALTAEGPIPIASILAMQVADIPFDGVVNMPEEGNRFVFRDRSIVETARRLFLMDSAREQAVRESVAQDKLHFVRGKRVLIVLDPDLDHIVADRLTFDRMDNLWRYHSVAEALAALERGPTDVITEYFERQGYGLLVDALEQAERDRLMVALLGDGLLAALEHEVRTVRPYIGQLDDEDLQRIFYNLPASLLEELLAGVMAKAYDRFLALVPPKIREAVILEFLGTAKHVRAAWRGIAEAERGGIVETFLPWLLGVLQLTDSDAFKADFPKLQFEFQRTYHSSMLAGMEPDTQQATLALIAGALEKANLPRTLAAKLGAERTEHLVVDYVRRRPQDFYNRLNPVVRKQIWLTVGREYRDRIGASLHSLDKIEILMGLRTIAVEQLFAHPDLMARFRPPEEHKAAATVFLLLKKLDKAESKTALLKKLLGAPEHRERRLHAVPAFLTDPDNRALFEKLAERVEDLELRFDSVICTRADHERLAGRPGLEGALVTLVDDLVDPGLFDLFQRGELSREEYDAFSRKVDQELTRLRRQFMRRERDDPAGVYLVETMQILNEVANKTLTGGIGGEDLLRLDARQEVRQRLVASFRENVRNIETFLKRSQVQQRELQARAAKLAKEIRQQEEAFKKAYSEASGLLGECRHLLEVQARAEQERRKVALTQRELSLQFFEIIQPLILAKIRSLGNPLKALLRMMGVGRASGEGKGRRVIFRFSDEEIANILRYRIVFCSRDPVLMQFVATCLRIDELEDSLFHLATAETLPHKSDIDILFYGPGYSVEDFAENVAERRIVPFADEQFYERLLANERLKARTKALLGRTAAALAERKGQLAEANAELKGQQARRRELQGTLHRLRDERARLKSRVQQESERRLSLQSEQEILDSRLADIDSHFERIKERVASIANEGGDAAGVLRAGRTELGETLRGELTALNRELARLMFVKGVKDAGDHISRSTQQGLLQRLEAREAYRPSKGGLRRLVVADDGSTVAQNLRQVFVAAALGHFKLSDRAVTEFSLKRLAALAESGGRETLPLVALFADRPKDEYTGLKQIVRRLRKNMPETFQLVVTPFGDLERVDRAQPYYRNLLALREQAALVNAALDDYTVPATMQRLLAEKAPLE